MGFFVFSSYLRTYVSQSICNKKHTDPNVPNCHLRATPALPAAQVEDRQKELSLALLCLTLGAQVPMKY